MLANLKKAILGDDNGKQHDFFAKDTRLSTNDFLVQKTFQTGFPPNLCIVAWDPLHKLLALGSESGIIKILGDSTKGNDISIECTGRSKILFLDFVLNKGTIIVVFEDIIELWEINSRKSKFCKKFEKFKITCAHLPINSHILFFGTNIGNVYLLNLNTFEVSESYVIEPVHAMEGDNEAVVGIEQSSENQDILMIGYLNGIIVCWNLDSGKVAFRYKHPEKKKLSCFCFSPDSKKVLAVYDDCEVMIWKGKQDYPDKYFYRILFFSIIFNSIATEGKGQRNPVKKVHWLYLKWGKILVFLGGSLTKDAENSLLISVEKKEESFMLVANDRSSLVDFVFLRSQVWPTETESIHVAAVTSKGNLMIEQLSKNKFIPIHPPPAYVMHIGLLRAQIFADIDLQTLDILRKSGNIRWDDSDWPINGGPKEINSQPPYQLWITCHESGHIRFWSVGNSSTQFELLYSMKVEVDSVRLPCDVFFASEKGNTTLIITFGNGEVEFYTLEILDPDFVISFVRSVTNVDVVALPVDKSKSSNSTSFRLKYKFKFLKVSTLSFCSSWQRLAVADRDGLVTVFDTSIKDASAKFLVNSVYSKIATVSLLFCELPVIEKEKAINQSSSSSQCLIMASKLGTIYALNLQSSDSLTLWKNDNKIMLSVLWINSKGTQITIDNRTKISLQNSTGELTGSSGSENSTESKQIQQQPPNSNFTYVLAVCESEVVLFIAEYNPKSLQKIGELKLKVPIVLGFVANVGGENCFVVFDKEGIWTVYSIGNFNIIFQEKSHSLYAELFESNYNFSISMGFLLLKINSELWKVSVRSSDIPVMLPALFIPGIEITTKQQGTLKGILAKKKQEKERKELFDGTAKPKETAKRTESKAEDVSGKTQDVKDAVGNAMKGLQKRGEQLENLADKSNQLNNAAADFLANVNELKRREENKKWYEL